MFDQMHIEARIRLLSLCCAGSHCLGDAPSSKVFFQFLPGKPIKNKIVIWLRFVRDGVYVMNPEPPSNAEEHWEVAENRVLTLNIECLYHVSITNFLNSTLGIMNLCYVFTKSQRLYNFPVRFIITRRLRAHHIILISPHL
jgi:hypothetical protein